MRLHLVCLPHTELTDQYSTCAYTQKARKFARAMSARGHSVYLYGPDVADRIGTAELVPLHDRETRARWGFNGGFDTVHDDLQWDVTRTYWQESNRRAAVAVRERAEQQDLLLLATSVQLPVAIENPVLTAVEYGVGYEGVWAKFCAFESYAWMHHVYGLQQGWSDQRGDGQDWRAGRAFDQVIPNLFDPDDFTFRDSGGEYLLFMGRLIGRKGPHIALEIAHAAGMPLVIAGPGATEWGDGYVRGPGVDLAGDLIYVGELRGQDRADALTGAACLLCPTVYLEPFGGVAVEAMLSGTPVVASDWGAFPETVQPGVTGYRFRTLQQGVDAVQDALRLDRRQVRDNAVSRYSLEAVAVMYEDWFDQLLTLWGDGWYHRRPAAASHLLIASGSDP